MHLEACSQPSPPIPHNKDSSAPVHTTTMVDPISLDAASILLHLQKKRLNFSPSMATVSLPPCRGHFCVRDSRRVKSILNTGKLPGIDWRAIKRDFERNLSQLLHRPCISLFLDTSSFSDFGCQGTDLDLAMFSGNYDACVVHGEHLVYVSTFPPTVCK
jgi:hypothetical protein